jgi:lysophospholipase L1-like esterase
MTIFRAEGIRPFIDALAAKKHQVLVALGDSNTCNTAFTAGGKQWPELLHSELRDRYGTQEITLVNAGVSGDAVTEALKRLERDVLRYRPDLTMVCLGSNDAGRLSDEQFRAGLEEIIERVQAAGSLVVVRTPSPIVEHKPPPKHLWGGDATLRAKNAITREVAARRSLPLIDTYEQFWARERAGALDSGALYCDEVHLNAEGHRLMARGMAPAFGLDGAFAWERPR